MRPLNQLIDLLYPPRCALCGEFLWQDHREDGNRSVCFCEACLADFRKVLSPLCPVCGVPFLSGLAQDRVCEECLRKRPFYDAAAAPFLYEGSLMRAIHLFKYEAKSSLAGSLGPMLAEFAQAWPKPGHCPVIVPVPLHSKRLRERGFNQSLLLARHVAESLGAQIDFLALRRVRYTTPQTGLGKKERKKNVRKAFQVVEPSVFKGRTVLLVDDVATTGNTLDECARVLKRSGCKKVYGLTLARAADPRCL